MARPNNYPDELIQRGVQIALEAERPIAHIAHDLAIHPETLRKRVRRVEADSDDGKTYPVASVGGRTSVTWNQQGLTCVIAAPSGSATERLVELVASRNV